MMTDEILPINAGDKIDLYLERITPFGYSGAVLIARSGNVILNKGYGLADRTNAIPNTSETVFNLGSITKQFTATAIMKLEMLGLLNTSDSIGRHLPGLMDDKSDITLHHLLTHTAGLEEIDRDDFEIVNREQMLSEILDAPLKFAPGTRYAYSNAGYTVLAAIVEEVSGIGYEPFLQENLFELAGMRSTGYRLPNWVGKPIAHWYVNGVDQGISLEKPYPSWSVMGNGEMLSTTGDMYRWHRALESGLILSREIQRKMYSPYLRNYAYGWEVTDTPHGRLARHGGTSDYGSSASFERYLDQDIVIMLFCNQDYAGGDALARMIVSKVTEMVFGEDLTIPEKVLPFLEEGLKPYTGNYRSPGGEVDLLVRVEDGALRLSSTGKKALTLLDFPARDDRPEHQMLDRQAKQIFTAALSGDFNPLELIVKDRGIRMSVLRRMIIESIQKLQADHVRALGTVPSNYIQGGLDTYLKIEGPQGEDVFLFVWEDGMNAGMARLPADPMQLSSMAFHPLSSDELLGYHLGGGQIARLIVERSEKEVSGLKALTKSGPISFERADVGGIIVPEVKR